jgi:NAD(P)H dehydrogenase (quinone)
VTKPVVLYYSSYGHIEAMAETAGVRAVGGTEVVPKRVPELVPVDVVIAAGKMRKGV